MEYSPKSTGAHRPPKAFKIKLTLSYDGTEYGGWQRQKGGKPTVQGTLEKALSRLFDEEIKVCGAGRTDAGVHARAQVVHFWASKPPQRYRMLQALYSLLPRDIAVSAANEVAHEFHAIGSATLKTYKYSIFNRQQPCALQARWTHWIAEPLDLEQLQQLANPFVGKMDFKSFQSAGTEVTSTVREIKRAGWEAVGPNNFVFTVIGNGFLKQMVRNIVGTQLEILQQKKGVRDIEAILEAKDRQQAGPPAPPGGLVLYEIEYPLELDRM